MLNRLLPFLRWFPPRADALRGDLVAGVTVALVLIPQSMAYATLAGLPVVYGLYAAFLPVMVASMWGASRFLHTGPVALLSLMSAAAIEPLASRGSDEFIQLSMTLALMVGVMRLGLGLFRMGVLINLASHPVINGFTNAAALIIGLSLVNSFINVPMPRSDMFLRDLWHVALQLPLAHWPTIAFALGTLLMLWLLKRLAPRAPGVLVVVVLGTVISAAVGFEKTALVAPAQIEDAAARAAFERYAELESALKRNKQTQGELRHRLATLARAERHDYSLEAEALRLTGEEQGLKKQLYGLRVSVYRHALMPVESADGQVVYRTASADSWTDPAWRFTGIQEGRFKLSGGGQVVGDIPAGLPSLALPAMDLGVMGGLLGTAFIMALIGFMEATSISRALAAQSREKLDPNQELIGQGLANIVGSFFQSYTVSGSFSRSAVAAKAGARTGFYAVVSALGVVLVMLFLTEYFHHLPQPVLAAIVMSAVFGLIDFRSLRHAWNVRRSDGVVGGITFAATLAMAPQLANGVLVGVVGRHPGRRGQPRPAAHQRALRGAALRRLAGVHQFGLFRRGGDEGDQPVPPGPRRLGHRQRHQPGGRQRRGKAAGPGRRPEDGRHHPDALGPEEARAGGAAPRGPGRGDRQGQPLPGQGHRPQDPGRALRPPRRRGRAACLSLALRPPPGDAGSGSCPRAWPCRRRAARSP